MNLSVIIPAYNTHQLTTLHVRECIAADTKPDEIIVVNDGGDPSLRDMLVDLNSSVPLIYARIVEDILWNYNGAYNLGVWLSRGDVLSFEDSDHLPSRDLYQNALESLKTPSVGCLRVRRVIIPMEDTLTKPAQEWAGKTIGSHENSCFLRREVFLNMKGNDEGFGGHYGWIGYDWKRRRNRSLDELHLGMGMVGSFYMVADGECKDVERGMSKQNYRLLHKNTKAGTSQHSGSLLNFHFTHDRLDV